MAALPWGQPLTYDDLQDMPEDGHRYELVDGVLLVSPSPRAVHQVCITALWTLLQQARGPDDLVMIAPHDYKVSDLTVLIPDLLVAKRADFGDRFITERPLLVVEVLSPSTRRTDLGMKRLAYEAAGVPAYWVVDPDEPALTAYHLEDGSYVEVAAVSGEQPYEASEPFVITIVPARLLDDLTA